MPQATLLLFARQREIVHSKGPDAHFV